MSPISAKDQFSTPLPADPAESIQWMPPGEHMITATQGGQVVTKTVKVGPETAAAMQRTLESFMASAADGVGDRPYLDFNHEDREASAHPVAFEWAGSDPKKGGVRARVEWTGPGKAAISGKAYRRFSPNFFLDADGRVTHSPLNMGGLVNRAAFQTIQPIWSRSPLPGGAAGADQPQQNSIMDPNQIAQLQTTLAQRDQQIADLNAKLAASTSQVAIQAKQAEVDALKATITSLQGQLAVQAKESAKSCVAAAVAAGKLPPQNLEIQAKWVDAIAANPALADTLNLLAANPALQSVVGGQQQSQGNAAGAGSPAQQFAQAVQAKAAELKVSKGAALDLVIQAKPDLYKAWREANGQPGL